MLEMILPSVIEAACTFGMMQAGQAMVACLRKWGMKQKASTIRQLLQELGCSSKEHIREHVERWLQKHPEVTIDEAQRENLIALLINLADGARLHTTHGHLRSSFVRSERLLEQLLNAPQPMRKAGERVTENSDWTLRRYLGRGSFGEVWMAANPLVPERRAYKFFTPDESLQRIRAEAETLFHISRYLSAHPNIVKYIDVTLNDPEYPHIALEYVGGGSLEDWIYEDHDDRPQLDVNDVIQAIVSGLSKAHEQGIAHRDLKPANIVLTEGPRPVPKITDFGLGRVAVQTAVRSSAQVSRAALVGTPMYLPPEAQGYEQPDDPERDDIFALGVIWYQLLMNRVERPPYDFAEELRQEGVDSHTIRLISRCLARRDHRLPNAMELAEEMEVLPPTPWSAPEGCFDVSLIFREYHAQRVG